MTVKVPFAVENCKANDTSCTMQHTKYRSILNFIPKGAGRPPDTETIDIAPGIKLLISEGGVFKLNMVTPAQWIAANSCILQDILNASGSTDNDLILDYMAHTTKIGELASTFTWESVIAYDDRYRQLQHEYGFRWGCDTPHMLAPSAKLVRRSDVGKEKNSQNSSMHRRFITACKYWNKEEPCRQRICKFSHVCEWCGSHSHPRIKHDVSVQSRFDREPDQRTVRFNGCGQ